MPLSSEITRRRRRLLGNQYAHLTPNGGFDEDLPNVGGVAGTWQSSPQNPYASINPNQDANPEVIEGAFSSQLSVIDLLGGQLQDSNFSESDIERVAATLQRQLWRCRQEIFGTEKVDPLGILRPEIAIRELGFTSEDVDTIGQWEDAGGLFEVAGLLDRDNHTIHVSRQFPLAVMNFTKAHELGHLVLHAGTGLHRDRAVEGGPNGQRRIPQEWQADKFATFFLMPEKLVHAEFKKRFLIDPFQWREERIYAFGSGDRAALESSRSSLDAKARIFAGAELYNNEHFVSLADRFSVSLKAMAIRLKELGLLGKQESQTGLAHQSHPPTPRL